MATSPMINLRAAAGLDAELTARGDSLSAIALRDLRRYYAQLAIAEREAGLSEEQWNYLRDILSGSVLDESLARYLHAEVEDAEGSHAQKWGVQPDQLAARLRELPEFSRLAIIDAVDRWWRQHGAREAIAIEARA